ncbi:MAG TPA: SRPBCC family protein [Nitrospira sp.]|nr:SRPBCC family protein [Nitrospira sp.]
MSILEKSIELNVPVTTAYNQWTQFEEFPKFMEGVEQVRQVDDKHVYWKASIGGKQKEWHSVITEQIPDHAIAWITHEGAKNTGRITFTRIRDDSSKLDLRLEYEPEGAIEHTGDMMGIVLARVEGDLQRFKEFIESRRHETGAWRGNVIS